MPVKKSRKQNMAPFSFCLHGFINFTDQILETFTNYAYNRYLDKHVNKQKTQYVIAEN